MPDSTTKVKFHFGKEERLCRKKIIDSVFENGESIRVVSFILLYKFQELPAPVPAQVLFAANRKNHKAAHNRNRAKRLMREAYRLQKEKHYNKLREHNKQAALLFIFTGRRLPDFNYVSGKVSELIQRFIEKIPTNPSIIT